MIELTGTAKAAPVFCLFLLPYLQNPGGRYIILLKEQVKKMEIVEGRLDLASYTVLSESGEPFARFIERELYRQNEKRQDYVSSTFRLIRVTGGESRWKIGSRLYSLHRGDLLVLNNSIFRTAVELPDGKMRIEIFEFMPDALNDELSCLDVFFADEKADCVISLDTPRGREINGHFEIIKNEMRSPDLLTRERIKGELTVLLVLLNRDYAERGIVYTKNERASLIKAVNAYVTGHISTEFDVDDICEAAGISRSRLSAVFRKSMGMSLSDYVRQCRVMNVISLLKQNDRLNVMEAASLSGFTSSSGFYKTFKSVMGMPPNEYLRHN